ncbi:hypothetical protein [Flammeovirga sp. SJP92]|uniref:hypothetical protein n=1 Tax=Flammeovirga sp. SJP92 TaxID=1775430 RepID=UPI000787D962|nr:hypothetical protein [Flammeovirga sp. SJP92]KXX72614.1 hypothetical protein AVL50_06325 [Flammeovirga sp. SJP92]
MKKVFLSATGIALTFVAFAFTPVQKNNSMGELLDTQAMLAAAGKCSTKMETQNTFSKCDNTWTEDALSPELMTDVLSKY